MKKLLYFFTILSTLIFSSCSGDDSIPEQPPTEVSNVDVAVIEGTRVRISWQESTDPNGDEIHYDIVVNNILVSDNAQGSSIEYDVVALLSKSSRKALKKGVSLDLNIKIKAYDTNNNVSDTVEVDRDVFVNRNPSVFDFESIYFDTYSYNSIEITWKQATDPDGDLLSYDVYLNDILIEKDYVIGTNSYNGNGRVYYNDSFYEYLNEEIIIKIIAKDASGGQNEISRSFNFRATDENLGSITSPSSNDYNFTIESDEPDGKIGYNFSLESPTGISVYTSTGLEMILRNENGDFIQSGYQKIGYPTLDSGNYYLELRGYTGSSVSGVLNLTFRDANSTDLDFGSITEFPFATDIELDNLNSEPDNKLLHRIEISQETAFSLSGLLNNINVNIFDSNNNYINYNYNNGGVSGIIRTPGVYFIEISTYGGYDFTNQSLNLMLQEVVVASTDLGVITSSYDEQFGYDNTVSSDGRTRFNFTVNSSVNAIFEIISADHDTYLYLYDSNGTLIYSDDDGGNGTLSRISTSLSAGSYYIEAAGYGGSLGSGTLRIML